MTLKQTKQRGFTIVELLIVVVIIAILAAVTIVAYNGIQNRAKTSAGQSAANSVVKKMEALNSIKGSYFASAAAQTGTTINTLANAAPVATEALIDQPSSIIGATSAAASGLDGTSASNGKVVAAWGCAAGANVWYYDYGTSLPVLVKAGAGC